MGNCALSSSNPKEQLRGVLPQKMLENISPVYWNEMMDVFLSSLPVAYINFRALALPGAVVKIRVNPLGSGTPQYVTAPATAGSPLLVSPTPTLWTVRTRVAPDGAEILYLANIEAPYHEMYATPARGDVVTYGTQGTAIPVSSFYLSVPPSYTTQWTHTTPSLVFSIVDDVTINGSNPNQLMVVDGELRFLYNGNGPENAYLFGLEVVTPSENEIICFMNQNDCGKIPEPPAASEPYGSYRVMRALQKRCAVVPEDFSLERMIFEARIEIFNYWSDVVNYPRPMEEVTFYLQADQQVLPRAFYIKHDGDGYVSTQVANQAVPFKMERIPNTETYKFKANLNPNKLIDDWTDVVPDVFQDPTRTGFARFSTVSFARTNGDVLTWDVAANEFAFINAAEVGRQLVEERLVPRFEYVVRSYSTELVENYCKASPFGATLACLGDDSWINDDEKQKQIVRVVNLSQGWARKSASCDSLMGDLCKDGAVCTAAMALAGDCVEGEVLLCTPQDTGCVVGQPKDPPGPLYYWDTCACWNLKDVDKNRADLQKLPASALFCYSDKCDAIGYQTANQTLPCEHKICVQELGGQGSSFFIEGSQSQCNDFDGAVAGCQRDSDCQNNGTCNLTTKLCQCTTSYTGPLCETKRACVVDADCNGRGTCNNATNECVCDDNYSGANCQNVDGGGGTGTGTGPVVPPPSPTDDEPDIGLIVGITLGVVALAGIGVLIAWLVNRKPKGGKGSKKPKVPP